jgi:hypothetical protein
MVEDLKPHEVCPQCDRESEARMAEQITRLMVERDRYKRALEYIEVASPADPTFVVTIAHRALYPGMD